MTPGAVSGQSLESECVSKAVLKREDFISLLQ